MWQRDAHGPRVVVLPHDVAHHLHALGVDAFAVGGDLVADRPHDDRRMIAVAHHQAAQVPLGVLLVRRLAVDAVGLFVPLVEALVPHDEAHAVAQLEQLGRRRVVAGADGVDAHVAHDLELPLHGPRIERRAQRAVVVVQAHAVELHAPAVEMEAVVGREFECADAERTSSST